MGLLNRLKGKLKERGGRHSSLKRIVRKTTRCPSSKIFIGDAHLSALKLKDVTAFLKQDLTDKKIYTGDPGWNCDKYALRLMSNAQVYFIEKKNVNPAFGLCWAGGHAFNLFYCLDDNKIHFIEPQLDKEIKLLSRARFVLF